MWIVLGSILFIGRAIGKVKLEDVMRGIWPFYGVMSCRHFWPPALVVAH